MILRFRGLIRSKIISVFFVLFLVIHSNVVILTVSANTCKLIESSLQVKFIRDISTRDKEIYGFILRINDLEITFIGLNTTDVRAFFKDKENYLAHNYSYMWFSPISKPHRISDELYDTIRDVSDIIVSENVYQKLVDKNISVIFVSNYTGTTFSQKIIITNYIEIENETDWCPVYYVNGTVFTCRSTIETDEIHEVYSETTIMAKNVSSINNPSLAVYSAAKYLKENGYQYGGVIRIFAVPTVFYPEFADDFFFIWYIIFSKVLYEEYRDIYYILLVGPEGDVLSLKQREDILIPPSPINNCTTHQGDLITFLVNPLTLITFGSILSLVIVAIVIIRKRKRRVAT